jgi:TM2 domain-containing membrane protein YozV
VNGEAGGVMWVESQAAGAPTMDADDTRHQWFYTHEGRQVGPVTIEEIQSRVALQQLKMSDYVWRPGMPDWVLAREVPELLSRRMSPPKPPPLTAVPRPSSSDLLALKIAAGICGVLLGTFGVHKFVLGLRGPGMTMLLLTLCTFGIAAVALYPIGVIEGIIYLAKSEDEFYRDYLVDKRGWF